MSPAARPDTQVVGGRTLTYHRKWRWLADHFQEQQAKAIADLLVLVFDEPRQSVDLACLIRRWSPVSGGVMEPVYYDGSGDGVADMVVYDSNGDELPDTVAVDSNHDGRFDTYLVDRNQNGVVDTWVYDLNEDGVTDSAVYAADTNGDGYADTMVVDSNGDGRMDTSYSTQSTAAVGGHASAVSGAGYTPPSTVTVGGVVSPHLDTSGMTDAEGDFILHVNDPWYR